VLKNPRSNYDYRLDYDWIFWVGNFKTRNYFVHSCLIFGISELSTVLIAWQNNNMHVKMTRIESGVTLPKDLFTLYVNVKMVTVKIFWPP
jgi:hypothetical protein